MRTTLVTIFLIIGLSSSAGLGPKSETCWAYYSPLSRR